MMRVLRFLSVGFVLLLLFVPAASALTFFRTYEASSAYVWGGPSTGGAFAGTVACNRDTDTVADTGACVRYYRTGVGAYDFRGGSFSVSLNDAANGANTYFLLGFDTNGDRVVDCPAGEPCYIGKGTISGTIPSTGDSLWIFPATVKSSGPTCCPQSFATRGSVTITFS